MRNKVILVTGASSGMGFETAKALAQQGNRAYGAVRRLKKMAALKQYGVTPIKLDVTDEASSKATVAEIIAKEGRIDVLIDNAGYISYGAIEDVDLAEAKRQLDVNLFGLAALTKNVLPYMRSSIPVRLSTFHRWVVAWYRLWAAGIMRPSMQLKLLAMLCEWKQSSLVLM